MATKKHSRGNLRVPPEIMARLKREAKKQGRSANNLGLRVLDSGLPA